MNVSTYVQSVPNRPQWPETLKSIRASDVGTDFYRSVQPRHLSARDHFLDLLRRMARDSADLVLRLEDDCVVNKSILHNVATCPHWRDHRCGALWLFCPLDRPYDGLWDRSELHGSVGVALRPRDIPHLIPRVRRWFEENNRPLSQDIALSRAVWLSGKRVFLHQPALVDHQEGPSAVGNDDNPAVRVGAGFDGEWRR